MIALLAALALQGAAPAPVVPAPARPPPGPTGSPFPAVPLKPFNMLRDDAFPRAEPVDSKHALVGIRLEVGKDGRVSACTIIRSSGLSKLDARTCRLLIRKARFAPARDSRGKPVPDIHESDFVWRFREPRFPSLPALWVATMRATPDGTVSCSYVVNQSAPAPEICLEDLAAMMSGHAHSTGRVAEQILVTIMTPEGAAEPADREDHGPLAYDSEVVLSIAADGSVLECRVIREEGAIPTRYWPPAPCEGQEPGVHIFAPVTQPGPPRKFTVKSRRFERW